MHEYDVITRRAVFRNVDTRRCTGNDVNTCDITSPVGNSKVLQKASSVSLDFEATASPFHLVKLSGRCVISFLMYMLCYYTRVCTFSISLRLSRTIFNETTLILLSFHFFNIHYLYLHTAGAGSAMWPKQS